MSDSRGGEEESLLPLCEQQKECRGRRVEWSAQRAAVREEKEVRTRSVCDQYSAALHVTGSRKQSDAAGAGRVLRAQQQALGRDVHSALSSPLVG